MRPVVLLAGLFAVLPASAQAACDTPYTTDNLLNDLVNAEDAIRRYDAELAKGTAQSLEKGIGCMNELIPSMMIDRVYRAIGGGLVLGSDAANGMKWFRTAAQLNPTFEYGLEDLDADHSLRFVYDQARREADAQPDTVDMNLAEGSWTLDGRTLTAPEARGNRFHLLQRDFSGVNSWVIDGSAFPEDVLVAPVVAEVEPEDPKKAKKTKEPKAPKEKPAKAEKPAKEPKPKPEKVAKAPKSAAGTSSSGAVVLQRERPPEKTPLMIAGGVLIAGAGGLAYWSTMARTDFENADNSDDVQAAYDLNRALVVASGATLAVGLGVGIWGIVLDSGPVIGPRVNVRF